MSKSIDLVIVDTEFKKVICYAPYNTVREGDTVITEAGNGQVVETLYTFSSDDVFQFFKRNTTIYPIRAKLCGIDYEGLEV